MPDPIVLAKMTDAVWLRLAAWGAIGLVSAVAVPLAAHIVSVLSDMRKELAMHSEAIVNIHADITAQKALLDLRVINVHAEAGKHERRIQRIEDDLYSPRRLRDDRQR